MLLFIIRAVFVLVAAGLGVKLARIVSEASPTTGWLVFVGVLVSAFAVVIIDHLTPRKRIQTISAIFIGSEPECSASA